MHQFNKYVIILSFILNLGLSQSAWVKIENGCEYWTSQTDVEKIAWDGVCKDGEGITYE